MKLSTKGRYAVTAMLDLALHHHKGPVTLTDISIAQSISLSYLEQLFAKLRNSGLVEGVRGPGGGYRLAKSPEKISVANIIVAVDDQDTYFDNKPDTGDVTKLWERLSERLYMFLDTMTLDQFVPELGVKDITSSQDEETQRMNFIIPPPSKLS